MRLRKRQRKEREKNDMLRPVHNVHANIEALWNRVNMYTHHAKFMCIVIQTFVYTDTHSKTHWPQKNQIQERQTKWNWIKTIKIISFNVFSIVSIWAIMSWMLQLLAVFMNSSWQTHTEIIGFDWCQLDCPIKAIS